MSAATAAVLRLDCPALVRRLLAGASPMLAGGVCEVHISDAALAGDRRLVEHVLGPLARQGFRIVFDRLRIVRADSPEALSRRLAWQRERGDQAGITAVLCPRAVCRERQLVEQARGAGLAIVESREPCLSGRRH
ncbi:hypothetical protein J2T57_001254 [Natronocella acetinitrilica]|uniref:Uncharacterized protein n=1 Tax=Natronocella acetinitrilica TaxID=414046 RepID=A0AAE3KFK2_9GAMM|nr:hypothetical protein [Natronocella acetinitrilica]MCP1674152.1 hypothetical protein [Natronocella acetinitrilica]